MCYVKLGLKPRFVQENLVNFEVAILVSVCFLAKVVELLEHFGVGESWSHIGDSVFYQGRPWLYLVSHLYLQVLRLQWPGHERLVENGLETVQAKYEDLFFLL